MKISAKTVATKVEQIETMLRGIASLPLESEEVFLADPRMVAAGESFLRRALEALLDLGRHILAKGFSIAAVEYKTIPIELGKAGVLSPKLAELLTKMAGYRNRLVHFYEEVTPDELYELLKHHVDDIEGCVAALTGWLASHPELVDTRL